MKKKSIMTLIADALSAVMLVGCGSNAAESKVATADTPVSTAETNSEAAGQGKIKSNSGDAVTLKLFSNLPDRKNGQGLMEQTIIDEYMTENPNVKIEVEALDEEAYKTKFKAYAMDEIPDVVSIWGQPSFLGEVLEAGVLAELKEADYADYGFVSGSLEGFKKDGALYGFPINTDIAAFYYNQKMFEDDGWR